MSGNMSLILFLSKLMASILNYSYWLIQRNYVEGKMQENGNFLEDILIEFLEFSL